MTISTSRLWSLIMRAAALFVTILTMLTHPAAAQTWQWGRTGGSIFAGLNAAPYETVVDMATDPNGNVYSLAYIEASNPASINGAPLVTYGQKDLLLFKYDCNGNYKWSKVIGGPEREFAGGVGTDSLGHVYVSGSVVPASQTTTQNQVHFSTDSAQAPANGKTLFLAQYDTSGTFKWLRQPNPDTAAAVLNATISKRYAMDVRPNGDVYWLVLMNGGVVTGGGAPWLAAAKSTWILHYNAAGVMTGHIPVQLELGDAKMSFTTMAIARTGKIIITGTQEALAATNNFARIAGQNVTHTLFVAAFAPGGQFLWKRENSTSVYLRGQIHRKPLIDEAGNIYVSGLSFEGDSFNSYPFHNSISTIAHDMPFITKMDSNGNHRWTKAAGANSANLRNGLAFRNSTEIWMSGTSNSLYWDSTHYFFPNGNLGYQYYICRFDTAGQILSLDSLVATGNQAGMAEACAADKRGNLYIGGSLGGDVTVAGTLLQNNGGDTDFLLAKFGYPNCRCTAAPVASFTKNITGRTLTLSYTGTPNMDSVSWSFGNGVTITRTGGQSGSTVTYTYPAGQNGAYTVCVTSYSACGSGRACQGINGTGVGIARTTAGSVKIYPNPAVDELLVEGMQDASVAVLNPLGRILVPAQQLPAGKGILPVGSLPAGIYLLKITDKTGAISVLRFVKQ